MADDINTPISFRGFRGVNTLSNPWELGVDELQVATNYNISKKGKLLPRLGRVSKLTGGYKSLWTNGDIILANRNGNLVQVSSDFSSYSVLRSGIGSADISYADCNGKVAWSNGSTIEYIESGYSKPFPTPTETDRVTLPPGQLLAWFKNCLWVAQGRIVWCSDPFIKSLGSLDKREMSRQFQDALLMMLPVEDGMWFSDSTGIYHAGGRSLLDMNILTKVADYPARKGMFCKIDGKLLPTPLQDVCYAIGTERGVCIIGNGGAFYPITEDRIPMLSGSTGAMVFNKNTTGLNQIIAVSRP